jgi:hypothetical protein
VRVFLRSVPQGVSWGTTRELLAAVAGPRARRLYHRLHAKRASAEPEHEATRPDPVAKTSTRKTEPHRAR